MKRGKRYKAVAALLDRTAAYETAEAIELVQKTASAKFDETIELHIRLGVDSRHADQQVRGAVVLPHGTGRTKRVLVFAKGPKAEEAREAGADFVGADDMVDKIRNENWFDYDVVVATPDMMGVVGKLGKILGPKGPDAEPEVRHRHDGRHQGDQRDQSRQDRVPSRQNQHHPLPDRQEFLRPAEAVGELPDDHGTPSSRPSRPPPRASTCAV